MKNSDLKQELSRLKIEKKRTLRVINSIYFVDARIRNEQFEKIKVIDKEIGKIEFKLRFLKERENVENSNSTRA